MDKLREPREVLERHRQVSWPDFVADIDRQYTVRHALFLTIQICLDICAHIITVMGAGVPAEYADMPRALAKLGILPTDLAERLAQAGGFRNRLIHGYRQLSLDQVYKSLQEDLGDFDQFAYYIGQLLKRLAKV